MTAGQGRRSGQRIAPWTGVARQTTKPCGTQGGVVTPASPPQVLQRVERARRVVSHCSQAAIRAYDEEALLSEACRNLIDEGGYRMAWFAEAQAGGAGLNLLAHAGSVQSGVRGDPPPWTNGAGVRTPAMRAVREQRPQVVRGIPDSPALRQQFPEAELLSFGALCSFPIQLGPHGAGAFTICAREADAFAPEEVALLRELAGDMAVGASVLRARKANEALEERMELAELRFRSIVEHAPVGILQASGDGRIVLANDALATLLGYGSPAQLLALDGGALAYHLGSADLDRVRKALAAGPPYPILQLQVRCVDGAQVWVQVRAKPASAGSEGAIEAFVRDLTLERSAEAARAAQERQRLEVARLQELDRVRSEFMGRASHELNTPLTPILLQVQALQATRLDERQARGLALIERNVLRLSGLVKDLLTTSTLEAGRVELKPTAIDLDARAAAAVAAFRERAGQAGVDLRHEPAGRVPAFADGGRVDQVLHSLVGNAIKFTPRGGAVTLRCEPQADGLALCTVADTGRGFPPEEAARLFEPFARLHDHLPGDPGGTGLGLFISKSLAEQSGGTLWAQSAGRGKGATFGVTFPAPPAGLAPEEPQPAPEPEPAPLAAAPSAAPAPARPVGRGIRMATGFGDEAEAGPVPDEAPTAPEPAPPARPGRQAAGRTRSR
jgi:PAS domain S-box-containing protein